MTETSGNIIFLLIIFIAFFGMIMQYFIGEKIKSKLELPPELIMSVKTAKGLRKSDLDVEMKILIAKVIFYGRLKAIFFIPFVWSIARIVIRSLDR
jgi:hypothetical protein